jgi:hypothetical protein
MIKKTLCFSNPAYLSLRDAQLVIKLPEVEKADNLTEDFKKSTEVTRPRFYYVPIFHLCTSLCKHGKCRGSS